MGLIDLFKPDWQHSTPERRKLAVAKIEDPETFAEMLAKEQVQSVKDEIYKKHNTIDSLQRLIPLVQGSDKTALEQKLHRLRFTTSLDTRDPSQAHFKDLDGKELNHLAREAQSLEVRLQALELIDDSKALGAIIQTADKQVARVAIKKVTDKKTLQKLLKSLRPKGIRLLVQEHYDGLFGEEERAIEKKIEGQAQLETILQNLEKLTTEPYGSIWSNEYAKQVDLWQEFSQFAAEYHYQRFNVLWKLCQSRQAEYEKFTAAEEARAAETRRRMETRRRLLHELVESTEVPQENHEPFLADLKWRWKALKNTESEEEIAYQKQFENALQAFEVNQNLFRNLQDKKEVIRKELQTILDELTALKEIKVSSTLRPTLQTPRKYLRSLDDYFKKEFSSLYETCQSVLIELDGRIEAFEREAEILSAELTHTYETLIGRVNAFKKRSRANTEKIKEMQATWKTLANLDPKTQENLNKRFQQSCDQYFAQLKEETKTREWAEFSNLAVKEQLIAETAALEAIDDPVELAKKIKENQTRWKAIGPVPYAKSKEIWTRFKTISDSLYERCKAYYEEQDTKRQKSLETKLALCEEAEALQHSQDWNVVGEKLKALQVQWQEAGHGPRRKEQLVWKRFRAACDTFFAARKAYLDELEVARAENTQRKQALVEEMEKWAASEKLREAAQRIKELQTEWKSVGPATRDQDQKLWTRFHKAGDEFFAKRREEYNKIQESLEENAKVKEAVCARLKETLETLNDDTDWTALSQWFRQSQTDWRALPGAGLERDQELWKTFKELCDRFYQARENFYDTLSDEDRVNLDTKEEYCLKVELLAESSEWRETADELKKLQAEYNQLPSVNEKYDRLMYKRFNTVCQTFFDRRREYFKEQDDQRQENLKRKKALCARLEELAGMKYQGGDDLEKMSREDLALQLQKAIMPNLAGEETVTPPSFKEAGQEVRELQAAWKAIGPVPQAQSQAVWERFRQAADTFYDKRKAFFAARRVDDGQDFTVNEAIITKLEAQLNEPDFKAVKKLQKQWHECSDVLRDKGRELQEKFQTLCDQISDAAQEKADGSNGKMRV